MPTPGDFLKKHLGGQKTAALPLPTKKTSGASTLGDILRKHLDTKVEPTRVPEPSRPVKVSDNFKVTEQRVLGPEETGKGPFTPRPAMVEESPEGIKRILNPGGGQFLLDAAGKPVVTPRDVSRETKTKVRGGSFAETQAEVDHKISKAIGGTDSETNLQALKSKPGERQAGKLDVEQEAIRKYQKGLITIDEARSAIMNWDNPDIVSSMLGKRPNITPTTPTTPAIEPAKKKGTVLEQAKERSNKVRDIFLKSIGVNPEDPNAFRINPNVKFQPTLEGAKEALVDTAKFAGKTVTDLPKMLVGSPLRFAAESAMEIPGGRAITEGAIKVNNKIAQIFDPTNDNRIAKGARDYLFGQEEFKPISESEGLYGEISRGIEKKLEERGVNPKLAKFGGTGLSVLVGAILENPVLGGEGKIAKEVIEKSIKEAAEKQLGRQLAEGEVTRVIEEAAKIAKLGSKEEREMAAKQATLAISQNLPSVSKQEVQALEEAAQSTKPTITRPPVSAAEKEGSMALSSPPPASVELVGQTAKVENPNLAGNIRLDKFDIPDGAKEEIRKIVDQNDQFLEQRRGTRSWEQTNEAATQIARDLTNTKAGKALNAEELTSLSQTTAGLSKKIQELMEVVATPTGNHDLNKLKLAQAREQLNLATASLSGARAEAGRSLNILRQINKAIETGDAKLIREAKKFLGEDEWGKNVEKISRKLAEFGDDEVAKYRFIQNLQKKTNWTKLTDTVDWYFYNNLLSGPLTHVRNTFANAGKVLFNAASIPFAAAADVAKSGAARAVGKQRAREVVLAELPAHLKGIWAGLKDGWSKASFVFNEGFSRADVVGSEFRGAEPFKGRLPNAISRGLQASDQFFRTVSERAEGYSNAWRTAMQEGHKGDALAARAAELVENPTPKMIEQIRRAGAEGVYQQEGDKFAKMLAKAKSNFTITTKKGVQHKLWNPLKLVIPFVQTPYNVAKAGLEATPLGLFGSALKETGREASQSAGRSLLGTAAVTPLIFMAAEGKITGNGPSDPDLRDSLYAQGWQPNSVRIGDKWVSYQTTPLALPLSLVGGAADQWVYEGKKPDVGSIIFKVGNSLLNQSFLTGLSALQKAVADPERKGQAFLEGLASSALPLSGLQGQIARATDTTIRQPEGIKEKIQSGIPGMSKELPPRRTILGEESKRPGGVANNLLNPLKSSEIKPDPLYQELQKEGLELTFPSESINKRKLSKEEYSEFLRISGTAKRDLLEKVIASPKWSPLSTELKKRVFDRVIEKSNEQARSEIRPSLELRYLGFEPVELDETKSKLLNDLISDSRYQKFDDTKRKQVLTKALQK